jgi:hypothetical protein
MATVKALEANPIERELRIEASPEVVYEFLIEQEKMLRWQGRAAQLDPEPGGIFRCELGSEHVARSASTSRPAKGGASSSPGAGRATSSSSPRARARSRST